MTISSIIHCLHNWANPSLQESYDNAGLICGNPNQQVTRILVCLDATEAVVDEAIRKNAELIVAHHPIVFKGLKRFTGNSYVEKTLIKAIKNDIAIFAIHTNLDNIESGVNAEIANRLGIVNPRILSPKNQLLYKLAVFVPKQNADNLANAMFLAGAGRIGNYDRASFRSEGIGSFRPGPKANPHLGKIGTTEYVEELKLEMLVEKHLLNPVINAMIQNHPYEEVAYDYWELENTHAQIGSGMIGELPSEMPLLSFLTLLKEKFNLQMAKYTGNPNKMVKKVAFCGGSGSFLIPCALKQNADLFLSADFKYHEFFDAEDKMTIVDMGHYESEQFTVDLIMRKLQAQCDGIEILPTEMNTNPVSYFLG